MLRTLWALGFAVAGSGCLSRTGFLTGVDDACIGGTCPGNGLGADGDRPGADGQGGADSGLIGAGGADDGVAGADSGSLASADVDAGADSGSLTGDGDGGVTPFPGDGDGGHGQPGDAGGPLAGGDGDESTVVDCDTVLPPAAGSVRVGSVAEEVGAPFCFVAGPETTARWDWDADGTWDTEPVAVQAQAFVTPGLHLVSAEVHAPGSRVAYQTVVVVVAAPGSLLDVTTAADEDDAGASVTQPGQSGLSLREAMRIADSRAGRDTIRLRLHATVALTAILPPIQDTAGVQLAADGFVIDAGAVSGVDTCLDLRAAPALIAGLTVRGCAGVAVRIGAGGIIVGSRIESSGVGVNVTDTPAQVGPDNTLVDNGTGINAEARLLVKRNLIARSQEAGVALGHASGGSAVLGNLIVGCATGISWAGGANGALVAHNTIWGSTGPGLHLPASVSGVDFRNNLVAASGKWGVQGKSSSFAAFDHNGYFDNASGNCKACDWLGGYDVEGDPRLVNPQAGDFTPTAASPLCDAGVLLDFDANDAATGSFNGAAPDIGGREGCE